MSADSDWITRHSSWGGAGQRIALISDLNSVVVMTANDSADYPRSPLAERIYGLVREAAKSSGRLRPNPPAAAELADVVSGLVAR